MSKGWEINITWSSISGFVDGWVPKLSTFVPVVGYLILFNDSITDQLSFSNIAGSEEIGWLDSDARLRFVYFGLVFLGLSNLIYYVARPRPQRLARNEFDYGAYGLENFTWSEIVIAKQQYADEEEQTAAQMKDWRSLEGTMQNPSSAEQRNSPEVSWNKNKRVYEDAIRSVLVSQFLGTDRSRSFWVRVVLAIAILGYGSLSVPGIEMFLRVLASTLS